MTRTPLPELSIAVIIPCYNEAAAIAQVVDAARRYLPQARVCVFDNRSTDDTAEIARAHGAEVVHVPLRGKGNVVRRMFADVEADLYLMVDGDATYDLSGAQAHVDHLLAHGLDMVVGRRVEDTSAHAAYRPGHRWGNRLLTEVVARLFGGQFSDMLSGYRIFSRRYVKSFPASAAGFEIETELTIHALELRMPFGEVPLAYFDRPEGSHSKLSTYRDGWRILKTILKLVVSERPLAFFATLAASLAIVSIALAIPLVLTYLETGLVPRVPTAVLVTGGMLSAMLSLACGAILHTVTLGRQEAKRLVYLSIPARRR